MPLEIAYRPFALPPEAMPSPARDAVRAASAVLDGVTPVPLARTEAAEATAACALPMPRPRDFAARIRRRDMVSVRRRLRNPSALRQRLAGVATIGLFALVLGPIGWGSPGGIDRAAAQAEAGALQPF